MHMDHSPARETMLSSREGTESMNGSAFSEVGPEAQGWSHTTQTCGELHLMLILKTTFPFTQAEKNTPQLTAESDLRIGSSKRDITSEPLHRSMAGLLLLLTAFDVQ